MRAGALSDRITFQRRTVATDSQDRMTITWADEFSVWADVQRVSETRCRFFVRYRSGITPEDYRIISDGKIWTITDSVRNRKRTMLTIDSDKSALVEATHLQSTEREYVQTTADVRPNAP